MVPGRCKVLKPTMRVPRASEGVGQGDANPCDCKYAGADLIFAATISECYSTLFSVLG